MSNSGDSHTFTSTLRSLLTNRSGGRFTEWVSSIIKFLHSGFSVNCVMKLFTAFLEIPSLLEIRVRDSSVSKSPICARIKPMNERMQNESNVWLLLSITRVDWIRYEQFLSLRTAYLGDRCMNILELSNIIEDNLIIPPK